MLKKCQIIGFQTKFLFYFNFFVVEMKSEYTLWEVGRIKNGGELPPPKMDLGLSTSPILQLSFSYMLEIVFLEVSHCIKKLKFGFCE